MKLAEIKQLWLKTLRDGNYRQVLCKTDDPTTSAVCAAYALAVEYGKHRNKSADDAYFQLFTDGLNDVPIIPHAVSKEVFELNDMGLNFEEIANWLEGHVDEEFQPKTRSLKSRLLAVS